MANIITAESLPDTFFITMAIGVKPMKEVMELYELTPADLTNLDTDPVFHQRLALAKDAVETDGSAFFARCRLLAGETLTHVTTLIRDPGTPAATQLEAWKTLVKYGRLEPSPAAATAAGPSLTFTIITPQGETVVSTQLEPPHNAADRALPHLQDPTPPHTLPHSTLSDLSQSNYLTDDDWIDPPDLLPLPERRVSARDLGFAV